MSRCLPFPPLGVPNEEVLFERIKIRREIAEAKRERKERRRRQREEGDTAEKERRWKHERFKKKKKKKKKRVEERSSWESKRECETEGPEQVLSDQCSDNSNSIKKDKVNSSSSGCLCDGRVIETEFHLQRDITQARKSICTVSRAELWITNAKADSHGGSGSRLEVGLRELVVEWNPPPPPGDSPQFDDQLWLFKRKPQGNHTHNVSSGYLCNASSSSSPHLHAQYLPQADIYALPYTTPY